jgi:hypothetical protein
MRKTDGETKTKTQKPDQLVENKRCDIFFGAEVPAH